MEMRLGIRQGNEARKQDTRMRLGNKIWKGIRHGSEARNKTWE